MFRPAIQSLNTERHYLALKEHNKINYKLHNLVCLIIKYKNYSKKRTYIQHDHTQILHQNVTAYIYLNN